MKYSVGYQLRNERDFLDEIARLKDGIREVYFSWGDFPNGRNSQLRKTGLTPWEAQRRQEDDLTWLSKQGIRFNLLFNATCYGKDSQSRAFFNKVGETVDYIGSHMGLESITTTSPLIGKFIHENFPGLEVRASVNMGIGTAAGMDYVGEYFDSFYIQREYNRDFRKIRELKEWCDGVGKKLYALANGGCLNHCSAHVFHDNLVSHESEISGMDNGYAFKGICAEYLSKPENAGTLLDQTSFVRPEDIELYEELFPMMKLATRVHSNPCRVLKAYLEDGTYSGSILDLLEPNHTALFYPWLLENRLISREIREEKLIYGNFEAAFIKLDAPAMLEEDYADK